MPTLSAWLDLRHGVAAFIVVRAREFWRAYMLWLRQWLAHKVMRVAVRLSLDARNYELRIGSIWPDAAKATAEAPTQLLPALPAPSNSQGSVSATAPSTPYALYRLRDYADLLHTPYRPARVDARYLTSRMVVMAQLLEHRPAQWQDALVRVVVDQMLAVGVDRVEEALQREIPYPLQPQQP